ILDEILIALREHLLAEEEILDLLKNKPASVELILTGRGASNKVLEAANLVTEMKEVKHPWRRGVRARKGIEY
ncbi:TPA: cob(I)yrinic acid a,c-diamide adenosyltransferase, partial [bacterium]|nr:cob(I)yrinic acid a,c-diamide adenosyltransferase [bacterium]